MGNDQVLLKEKKQPEPNIIIASTQVMKEDLAKDKIAPPKIETTDKGKIKIGESLSNITFNPKAFYKETDHQFAAADNTRVVAKFDEDKSFINSSNNDNLIQVDTKILAKGGEKAAEDYVKDLEPARFKVTKDDATQIKHHILQIGGTKEQVEEFERRYDKGGMTMQDVKDFYDKNGLSQYFDGIFQEIKQKFEKELKMKVQKGGRDASQKQSAAAVADISKKEDEKKAKERVRGAVEKASKRKTPREQQVEEANKPKESSAAEKETMLITDKGMIIEKGPKKD